MDVLQLYVAVPVVVSEAFTRPTSTLETMTVLVSRLMNVTFAFRTSPGFGSPLTAVMSWMVALSVTVAVLDVADDVEANNAPVYVAAASSALMLSPVLAVVTVKFGFTPPNSAVTVCPPGAICPVGAAPNGLGSRRATGPRLAVRLPAEGFRLTVPMT